MHSHFFNHMFLFIIRLHTFMAITYMQPLCSLTTDISPPLPPFPPSSASPICSFSHHSLSHLPPPLLHHCLLFLLPLRQKRTRSSSRVRIYILIYHFPAAAQAVMDGLLPAPRCCHELPWWLPAETATHWPLHHGDWWGARREKKEKKRARLKNKSEKNTNGGECQKKYLLRETVGSDIIREKNWSAGE